MMHVRRMFLYFVLLCPELLPLGTQAIEVPMMLSLMAHRCPKAWICFTQMTAEPALVRDQIL